MVGDEWIIDGMERGCEVIAWAALIGKAGYQPRDEKIHKRGKAALPL